MGQGCLKKLPFEPGRKITDISRSSTVDRHLGRGNGVKAEQRRPIPSLLGPCYAASSKRGLPSPMQNQTIADMIYHYEDLSDEQFETLIVPLCCHLLGASV